MKKDLYSDTLTLLREAVAAGNLVWFLGAGISASLTGKVYSWLQWIRDGISRISDTRIASNLNNALSIDDSTDNLVYIVGKVIDRLKIENTYSDWMNMAFCSSVVVNNSLANTLKKIVVAQDVVATTNFDSIIEQATGLNYYTYQDAGKVYEMLDRKRNTHVLHIHGAYNPKDNIDNIVASKEQYDNVLSDEGAQFVQHVLGTKTVIFVGCGQTTDDVNISRFIAFAKDKLNMERDYFYLYKEGQKLVELPENVHPVAFGDEYSDLPEFLNDIALLRLNSIISKNKIVGRTIYTSPVVSTDPLMCYHYAQQDIPFCGRAEELEKLFGFLGNNTQFSWWTITGQAGAGKSRLALEMLNRLHTTWFGFFLNDRTLKVENDFMPFTDTLVIIDYVCGRETIIADIIDGLYRLFSSTNYKLRILLIERENSREAGSWYAKMNQFGSYSCIPSYEYSNQFLNLQDLCPKDVCAFISEVCHKFGLPENSERDETLRDAYGEKFEQLQFRPLYVQMFVEAWIQNDSSYPHYDSFEDLLKWTLNREQKRWLKILNNNQTCCNALIRLIVRANISGELKENNSDAIYAEDWKIINDFIAANCFPGEQGEATVLELFASVCQNISSRNKAILPMYPDIIKEYMFFYYMDESRLTSVMTEIWKNIPTDFSTFITKCISDFPENEFYKKALNSLQLNTDDIKALTGRIQILRNEYLRKDTDDNVVINIILNEFEFWKHLQIPVSNVQVNEVFSVAKVAGLSFVAEMIGAYSTTNLAFYMTVIDEICNISGGTLTEILKATTLSKESQSCAISSHLKESEILRDKIDSILTNDLAMSDYNRLLKLENLSTGISNDILHSGDFHKSFLKLKEMIDICDENDEYSVYWPLSAAARIGQLSFQLNNPNYFDKARNAIRDLSLRHPDYYPVKLINAAFDVLAIYIRLCIKDENKTSLEKSVIKLDAIFKDLHIDFSKHDFDSYNDTVWGAYHNLKLNFIDSEDELTTIIAEADAILKDYPTYVDVIQAKIHSILKLHKEIRHSLVSREEVNDAYKHVLNNVQSESVRDAFERLLEYSTEKDKKANYRNHDIVSNAIHDALYNPLNSSGIEDIDEMFSDYIETPYQREMVKIGRNDPCPCGSGKKFKKCCIGKGIYD